MAVDLTLLNSNSLNNIETNFERVQTALQDAVSRSGNTPNQMNADLDMNSNDILNIKTLDIDVLYINGEPVVPNTLGSLPANSVGSSQIVDGSVGTAELADESVTLSKLDRSTVNISFDNKASAEVYTPASGPNFIRIEGYTSAGDGGAALYAKVAAEPGHAGKFSITLDDGVTIVWYEIAEPIINVKMLGAKGNNVSTEDDAPAINDAIALGKPVYIPKGFYYTSTPIIANQNGQQIIGAGENYTYLLTPSGSTHDIIRIGGNSVELAGIFFRPGSADNVCLRVFGGLSYIHNNLFLAAVNGSGIAVIMDDTNPADGTTGPGRYYHKFYRNRIGYPGYAFSRCIDMVASTYGIQACRFVDNVFIGNAPIRIAKGGGNVYRDNVFQSATGTQSVPAGVGLDLGANVFGELSEGNYYELFQNGVLLRQTVNTYVALTADGDHWDNCTNHYYSLGTVNYVVNDNSVPLEYMKGWQASAGSSDYYSFRSVDTEAYRIYKTSGAFEPKMLSLGAAESITVTANGQSITPTKSRVRIAGNGAHRTGCALTNGGYDGQVLVLFGISWSVEIVRGSNVRFAADAASATFGNTGNVTSMMLVWSTADGKWIEHSRTA